MQLFDGKAHADKLDNEIISYIGSVQNQGKFNDLGKLAIIQVGENPVSMRYVNLKIAFCEKMGIPVESFVLSQKLSDEALYIGIKDIVCRNDIKGAIIQLPLPRNSLNIIPDLIPEQKDIDVLTHTRREKFYNGDMTVLSPVIRSFTAFTTNCDLKLCELDILIIGKGKLVGEPIYHYLKHIGANVRIEEDYNTGDKINTELLILTTDIPDLVKGEDISKGCHIIDFGSSIINGKTVGNLNKHSIIDHLGVVSLSPGGMGPLVVRYLIMNFLNI